MKDANGLVEVTASGLSRLANLTYDETLAALHILESPDSKTEKAQEFEGRRIERTETGWLVLNHFKYRDKMKSPKRAAYQANWQKGYRAKQRVEASDTTAITKDWISGGM
jgi:hypothetical protein